MSDDPITIQFLLLGSMWFVAFLFSATVHEAAHAYAALRGGDPTAYEGGQVSLDPLPHIQREPVGMILVPLLSYFVMGGGWMIGWASTPIDPSWAVRHPRRAAVMSLAGPLANLALTLVAAGAIRLGLMAGIFQLPFAYGFDIAQLVVGTSSTWQMTATLLSILFTLNLVLCVFNLMPVAPLDGAGALPLLVGESGAERYRAFMAQPMMPMAGLLLAWILFPKIFNPVFGAALHALYLGVH